MKILKALAAPTDFNFTEEPLQSVVDYLSERHKIEIVIDDSALDDASIGTDEPVTFNVSGISLRSGLDLILRNLDLTWAIDSEVLLITTPDQADYYLTTKTYDVGDLVVRKEQDGRLYEDYDALIEAITSTVALNTWEEFTGGPGCIEGAAFGFSKVLVVRQTYQVHLEIARLLDAIRAMPAESTGVPTDKAEAKILRALSESTEISFLEEPLQNVLDYFSDRHKIEIVLDTHALEDVGLSSDEPVTFAVKGVSLRSGLDLILKNFDLMWAIDSEVLLITTSDVAKECRPVKVYDVSGLVTFRDQDGRLCHDFDELLNTIHAIIAPESWEEGIGCPGDIVVETFGDNGVLVLPQTWQVHLEIAQLLDTLDKISKAHAADNEVPTLIVPPPGSPGTMGGWGDMSRGRGIGFMAVGGAADAEAGADSTTAKATAPPERQPK